MRSNGCILCLPRRPSLSRSARSLFIPPPQALTGTSEAHSSPMLRCSLRHSGKHITTSESNDEKDIMKQRERTKEQQELQDALLPLGSRVYFHEEKGYTPSCTKGPFQASLSPRKRSLWGTRRYERWLRLRKTTPRVCDVILRLGDHMSLHPVRIQIASTVTHLSTPSRFYAS